MKKILIKIIFLFLLLTLQASASYQADIYLSSGAVINSKSIKIDNNKIIYDKNKTPISYQYIDKIEFKFDNFNNDICTSLFSRNKLVALESLLEELKSMRKFNSFENNLSSYYLWLLKSEVWNENYLDAKESIKFLQQSDDNFYKQISACYLIYILLKENKFNIAEEKLDRIQNYEEYESIKAMYNYLTARVYFNKKKYSKTLSFLANIITHHSNNSEWIAPTLFLEAEVYLSRDQREKAFNIVQEIKWIYPDSNWSNNAEILLNN